MFLSYWHFIHSVLFGPTWLHANRKGGSEHIKTWKECKAERPSSSNPANFPAFFPSAGYGQICSCPIHKKQKKLKEASAAFVKNFLFLSYQVFSAVGHCVNSCWSPQIRSKESKIGTSKKNIEKSKSPENTPDSKRWTPFSTYLEVSPSLHFF